MAKVPDYATMTYDELTELAGKMRLRQIELGDMLDADMSPAERLPLELERGEIRAHFNVIQPLRAKFLVLENASRSAENQRLAGMTDAEFDAFQVKQRALRQSITAGTGPTGSVLTPGA